MLYQWGDYIASGETLIVCVCPILEKFQQPLTINDGPSVVVKFEQVQALLAPGLGSVNSAKNCWSLSGEVLTMFNNITDQDFY